MLKRQTSPADRMWHWHIVADQQFRRHRSSVVSIEASRVMPRVFGPGSAVLTVTPSHVCPTTFLSAVLDGEAAERA